MDAKRDAPIEHIDLTHLVEIRADHEHKKVNQPPVNHFLLPNDKLIAFYKTKYAFQTDAYEKMPQCRRFVVDMLLSKCSFYRGNCHGESISAFRIINGKDRSDVLRCFVGLSLSQQNNTNKCDLIKKLFGLRIITLDDLLDTLGFIVHPIIISDIIIPQLRENGNWYNNRATMRAIALNLIMIFFDSDNACRIQGHSKSILEQFGFDFLWDCLELEEFRDLVIILTLRKNDIETAPLLGWITTLRKTQYVFSPDVLLCFVLTVRFSCYSVKSIYVSVIVGRTNLFSESLARYVRAVHIGDLCATLISTGEVREIFLANILNMFEQSLRCGNRVMLQLCVGKYTNLITDELSTTLCKQLIASLRQKYALAECLNSLSVHEDCVDYLVYVQTLLGGYSDDEHKYPNHHSQPQCPICYEALTPNDVITLTQCGHFFHGQCLYDWTSKRGGGSEVFCPLCRSKI